MWHNHPFSQVNKTTEKAVKEVGGCRWQEKVVGELGGWTKFEKGSKFEKGNTLGGRGGEGIPKKGGLGPLYQLWYKTQQWTEMC